MIILFILGILLSSMAINLVMTNHFLKISKFFFFLSYVLILWECLEIYYGNYKHYEYSFEYVKIIPYLNILFEVNAEDSTVAASALMFTVTTLEDNMFSFGFEFYELGLSLFTGSVFSFGVLSLTLWNDDIRFKKYSFIFLLMNFFSLLVFSFTVLSTFIFIFLYCLFIFGFLFCCLKIGDFI